MDIKTNLFKDFVSKLRTHAAANLGTEWDLLPSEYSLIALLVSGGRKWNRVVEGVGDKLRVLQAEPALGVAGVALFTFSELKAHPANSKKTTTS
jgi:hypothetical protein